MTGHFRGIDRIYPNLIKENRRISTCNRLDFANARISTDYVQKSPRSLIATTKGVTQIIKNPRVELEKDSIYLRTQKCDSLITYNISYPKMMQK